jgi:hypothetical protein
MNIAGVYGAIMLIIGISAIFVPAPYLPLLAAVYFPFLFAYVALHVNGK